MLPVHLPLDPAVPRDLSESVDYTEDPTLDALLADVLSGNASRMTLPENVDMLPAPTATHVNATDAIDRLIANAQRFQHYSLNPTVLRDTINDLAAVAFHDGHWSNAIMDVISADMIHAVMVLAALRCFGRTDLKFREEANFIVNSCVALASHLHPAKIHSFYQAAFDLNKDLIFLSPASVINPALPNVAQLKAYAHHFTLFRSAMHTIVASL